ncbi:MAG: hypothetical protein ABSH12_04990 [Endomicrobiales bacterium]|jgi:lipoate-protein ligase A
MALDEALFTSFINTPNSEPIIRLYSWGIPCTTIGYFQKYPETEFRGGPITRRLTGGLTVLHGTDISYAMVAGKKMWPWLYDQTETYRRFHSILQRILADLGFNLGSEVVPNVPNSNTIRCVETVYQHDLMLQNRKVVGSCQRRRGDTILLEGSIHIPSLMGRMSEVECGFEFHFSRQVGDSLIKSSISDSEKSMQYALMSSRYLSEQWNRKF